MSKKNDLIKDGAVGGKLMTAFRAAATYGDAAKELRKVRPVLRSVKEAGKGRLGPTVAAGHVIDAALLAASPTMRKLAEDNAEKMAAKPAVFRAVEGALDPINTAYGISKIASDTVKLRSKLGNPNELMAEAAKPSPEYLRKKQENESFQEAVERRLANPSEKNYGNRPDGSKKGAGWLGEIDLGDGNVATEYTMQSGAVRDSSGRQIDFPTLVPTLSRDEVEITKRHIRSGKPLPEKIVQKAIAHANKQLAEGKSVFAPPSNKR